jgi:type I restriction enzyme R subunit
MQSRGRQPNLSFFAFTATPKGKTLELFGRTGISGKPEAFHLYSMRQAIEEGFILDVLKNYTSYKTYYRLVKEAEDDPNLPKKKGVRALAKFMSLHPHNIEQKTEVMVEHFRRNVQHRLNSRAKAMVVTSSRLHAVRYKLAFDAYLKRQGYTDIRPLVAFSGTVKDPDTGLEYTEPGMNSDCVTGKPISEMQLPERFGSSDYQVLLVANKYQTGFDQPLLHTMYVAISDSTACRRSYHWAEVEAFADIFYRAPAQQKAADHAAMQKQLQPAVDRFKAMPDEEKRTEFREKLNGYVRVYAFMSQIVPYADPDMERLYSYGRFLVPHLPIERDPAVKLTDEVGLQYYRLERVSSGAIVLNEGESLGVRSPTDVGTSKAKDEKAPLSEIITVLNDKFGTEFSEEDRLFFEQIKERAAKNEQIIKTARANPQMEKFQLGIRKLIEEMMIQRMGENDKIVTRYMDDPEFQNSAFPILAKEIFDAIEKDEFTASKI